MEAKDQHSVVARQFDPQAQGYLTSGVHAQGPDLDRLSALVGERPGQSALDLGCGAGHVSYRLAPLLGTVVAFDLSERMLDVVAKESARRGHANISTVRGMAESLPFPDGTFDLVVTRYSAHHWSDVPRAVTEMRRVLKPGGMAVAMDVFAPDSPLLDTWLQSLELLRDPSHVRDHSLKEWRRYFADAGIGVKTVDSFRLRQEFKPWIDRMAPPESHVAAIRSLQEGAAAEVVRHFAFEANGSFTIDTMVISGS